MGTSLCGGSLVERRGLVTRVWGHLRLRGRDERRGQGGDGAEENIGDDPTSTQLQPAFI